MRLLYLIKGLGLGGAEKHVVQCALAFKEQGHEVVVAYLLDYKDAWVQLLKDAGVEVVCLGSGKFWWLGMWAQFVKLIRQWRPTLVHAHLPIPSILARVMRFAGAYRLVYTEHNEIARLHAATRLVHRLTHGLDDVAISCSTAVARSLPWGSKVIDNGIGGMIAPAGDVQKVRQQLNIAEHAVVLMCIANMTPKKNHALLLRAFDAAASQTTVDLHLILVGQPASEGANVEALRNSLTACQCIHMFGPHPNAENLLPEADVFVLASKNEGLPLSLLEAMAAGLPAIVTDVGGMAAVVGEDAGIVIPGNDLSALSEAIIRMANDAQLRKQCGKVAKERVREMYSEERMIGELAAAYNSVLGVTG